MERFCTNCGTRIPGGDRFCTTCGQELISAAEFDSSKSGQQNKNISPKSQKTGNSGLGWNIFIGIIIVISAVVVYSKYNTNTVDNKVYNIPTPLTFYSSSGQDYSAHVKVIANAIDYNNPITRNYAVQLAAKYPGKYSIDQICQIWDYLYSNWSYVSDPGGGYYAPASESINNSLNGDCDDFAILMSALIESIGGSTRFVVGIGEPTSHAWSEVYLGKWEDPKCQNLLQGIARRYKSEIYTHAEKSGDIWLNLDWSASHPGGPFYNADGFLIIRSNGYWQYGYFR